MDWLPLVYETKPIAVAAEWDKKYRNTFMRLNGQLVRATSVDNGYLHFMTQDELDLRIKVETDAVVDTSFPATGCFTLGDRLAFFSRVPARQFKKGLCSDNARIKSPLSMGFGGNIGIDFSSLKAAFAGDYLHPNILIPEVFSKNNPSYYGGAISSKWGLQKHPQQSDLAILFYNEFAVGEVTSDGCCTPIVPSFVQEINDFAKHYNLDMRIA